tara:strand:- start:1116 stop:1622 length:507 start_codon:yes stop_codon:yes gene_type:complete
MKMDLKNIAVFAIFLTILSGCSGKKDVPVSSSSTYVPLEVSIGLQRTMCYGTCPTFVLNILNDGQATLKVGRFTEEVIGRHLDEGNYKCSISIDDITEITTFAEANGYFKLLKRYDDERVMDLPAAISTINGKTVFNRFNGPNLDELYTKIETLMGQANWLAEPDTKK